jgi:hypothetical protein
MTQGKRPRRIISVKDYHVDKPVEPLTPDEQKIVDAAPDAGFFIRRYIPPFDEWAIAIRLQV